ncbi:MAG: divalent cation tolerance protein CutA [Candidatus Saccharimonadales bacterium]
MSDFAELVLTCANQQEADTIADSLLQKKLIACAKFLPVTTRFQWEGAIENSQEVLVMMEAREADFMEIEAIVAELHSYVTFVLKAVSINQISEGAAKWLEESLE